LHELPLSVIGDIDNNGASGIELNDPKFETSLSFVAFSNSRRASSSNANAFETALKACSASFHAIAQFPPVEEIKRRIRRRRQAAYIQSFNHACLV